MSQDSASLPSKLVALINWLSKAGFFISTMLVLLSALFVFVTSLSRYLFNAPFEYTFEISGYMMLTIVFLSLAYTVMIGRHIGITFVVNRLPEKIRKLVDLLMTILSLLWIIPFLIGCWYTWIYFFREHVMPNVGLEVPFWIPATTMIIGTALLLLQVFVEIGKKIKAMGQEETEISATKNMH